VTEPAVPRFAWWDEGVLTPAEEPPAASRLAVADSWLVDDGRVRALELHRERFTSAAARATQLPAAELSRFWDAAVAALPRSGRWFPRVDVIQPSAIDTSTSTSTSDAPDARARLALRLRPAPPLGSAVVVSSHSGADDPRTVPAVKGPDLARLLAIRAAAVDEGVDEVVILSPAGYVVDGTTSAILWWRGDRLFAPSAAFARVDSVTAKSIRLLASATGVSVGEERSTPAELEGSEVWAVNALHGIRLVSEWRGGPALSTDPRRSQLWRRRLDALARPLDQIGSP
jgi:branched-subunit amino acid aminotransferase/4-amino-4-deoxychorismate lyase